MLRVTVANLKFYTEKPLRTSQDSWQLPIMHKIVVYFYSCLAQKNHCQTQILHMTAVTVSTVHMKIIYNYVFQKLLSYVLTVIP